MKQQELRIGNIVGINGVEFEVVGVYDDVAYIQIDKEAPIEEIEIKYLEPIYRTGYSIPLHQLQNLYFDLNREELQLTGKPKTE